MTRQDWLTTCVVAVGVAMMTATLSALPMCWAQVIAEVPSLPSMQLLINSMSAKVTTTTTPAPGHRVQVLLTLNSPSRGDKVQVPVTVSILSTNMDPMARVTPPPQLVAKVDTFVPVGLDGNGSAVVELPLRWAFPAPAAATGAIAAPPGAPYNVQRVNSYQIVLSSTLGGQSAAYNLQMINVSTGAQVTSLASTQPAVQVRAAPTAAQPAVQRSTGVASPHTAAYQQETPRPSLPRVDYPIPAQRAASAAYHTTRPGIRIVRLNARSMVR